MNYGILLDVIVVAVLFFGFSKGYKKGVSLMLTPIISFVVGIILMKPVGAIAYNIFGNHLESFVENLLYEKTNNAELTRLLLLQILNEAMIERMVQLFVFVLAYGIISAITTTILSHARLRVNNQVINNVDKNIGGLIGVLSEVAMTFLVLAVVNIIFKFNFTEEGFSIAVMDIVNSSYVTRFLYSANPIIALLNL